MLGAMHKFIISAVVFLFSFSTFASDVLWREDKSASAYCKKAKESVCFVVVGNNTTDVSIIENNNIGKLGIASKSQYDKVVTFPLLWKRTGSDGDLIIFTTQAWLNGQRYTTKGMVFVDNDGKYIHQ